VVYIRNMAVLLIVIAGLALTGVYLYNSLVTLKNRVEGAQADIEALLQKRYDLIVSVAEAVKRYLTHEKDLLKEIAELRTRGSGIAEIPKMDAVVKGIFAVAEAYPELRSAEEMTALIQSLREVERDLADARRYYNAVLRDYNTKKEMFPWNLLSGRFPDFEYIDTPAEEEKRPEVGKILE